VDEDAGDEGGGFFGWGQRDLPVFVRVVRQRHHHMKEHGSGIDGLDRRQLTGCDGAGEDTGEDRFHFVEPLVHLIVFGFRHIAEELHDQLVHFRLIEPLVVDRGQPPQPLFDRPGDEVGLGELGQQSVHFQDHHFGEERFLAGEMMIEGGLAQSGGVRDVLHRDAQIAFVDEQATRRFDDALAAGDGSGRLPGFAFDGVGHVYRKRSLLTGSQVVDILPTGR